MVYVMYLLSTDISIYSRHSLGGKYAHTYFNVRYCEQSFRF